MSIAFDHGYLPAGKYIINHDIMNCTADGVLGNHLYSGRALGLSEPWDIIQLHPDLEPLWPHITAHYKRIGLSHSENVIWNLDLKQLGQHVGHQPSVFYFGPTECKYWGDRTWLEAVEYINSKNNFISLANQLGVDVPETICLDRIRDLNGEIMCEIAFPCYLKASISVSGVGIYRCDNMLDFVRAASTFHPDTPVQIQEGLEAETFLNMQFQIIDGEVYRLVASEQILDGFAHQGNRVPSRYAPWEAVEPMANWLSDHGMKGIFAFDVAVVQSNRGLQFTAIECNPRFNGASYPTLIAQKLSIPEWSAISVKTKQIDLADIDLSGLEYDPNTGQGIIIVNWGIILTKKLAVMLAGPPEGQAILKKELERRLKL